MVDKKWDFGKLRNVLSKDLEPIDYIRTNNNLYDTLPMPYMIVEKSNIVLSNNLFKKTFSNLININYREVFQNFNISEPSQIIRFHEVNYAVLSTKMSVPQEIEGIYFMVYFNPIASTEQLVPPTEDKIAICYFVIDNYDEALEGVEEIKIPLILALVDRKLNNFTRGIGGIVRKFEKDRYMVIFSSSHLTSLKEKKFEILKHIRDIDMGNKIPITLSIGIGHSGEKISELNDYARSSLDLALGRGGDQVVIRKGSQYEFFGGTGKELDRNTRVKARVKAYVLTELINDSENIIIMGHNHPDLDCIASGIGVYKIVKAVNPSAKCNIVVNEFTSSVSGLYNRLIEIEDYKTKVFINSGEAIKQVTNKTLVIVVDVFKEDLTECPELLGVSHNIVVFDHHRKVTDYITGAVLVYHDSTASSTSELVTEMIMYVKNSVKLLSVEADALLSGITVDTKGFTFKTGSKTFDAASFLKKKGADSHNVHVLLQCDLSIYKEKSNAVNNAIFYRKIMAMAEVNASVENPVLVIAQTADELLNLTDIKVSFVFCQLKDKVIISARSLGELNVQSIMEVFGGGGHRTMAAAQVNGKSIDEIKIVLENLIDNLYFN